jgi:hypothetical protein
VRLPGRGATAALQAPRRLLRLVLLPLRLALLTGKGAAPLSRWDKNFATSITVVRPEALSCPPLLLLLLWLLLRTR